MEFKNTKEYQEIKSICSETIEEFSKFFSLHSKDFMVSSFFSNQQNSYVYTKSKPHLKESLVPPRNRSNLFAPSSKPKFSCILKGWKEVNLFSRYGVCRQLSFLDYWYIFFDMLFDRFMKLKFLQVFITLHIQFIKDTENSIHYIKNYQRL